eukprot:4099366-Lingulodinium_polyedra.AAC.1
MELWLRRHGHAAGGAADELVVSVDGYLREQDAVGLLFERLTWAADGRSCAATFGSRPSGARSKTGWDQGVVFHNDYVLM